MVTLIFIIRVKMAQQNKNICASLIMKIMNVNNGCECEIGDELKKGD